MDDNFLNTFNKAVTSEADSWKHNICTFFIQGFDFSILKFTYLLTPCSRVL
jgi:hypothetical protein